MNKVTELFEKMDRHQGLADMAAKKGDKRQVVHHRSWVSICDLEL